YNQGVRSLHGGLWIIILCFDVGVIFHASALLVETLLGWDYDVAVCKTGPSIFFQTPVMPFFVKERVDTVIVTGCVTSGCIRASVIDAFQFGFRTIVPEDCVGDHEEQPHNDNLRDVGRRYCDVTESGAAIDYIEDWRRKNLP
ncbi:MAG: isochorismatase family protein, partial [Kiloniellaceae bacterium]